MGCVPLAQVERGQSPRPHHGCPGARGAKGESNPHAVLPSSSLALHGGRCRHSVCLITRPCPSPVAPPQTHRGCTGKVVQVPMPASTGRVCPFKVGAFSSAEDAARARDAAECWKVVHGICGATWANVQVGGAAAVPSLPCAGMPHRFLMCVLVLAPSQGSNPHARSSSSFSSSLLLQFCYSGASYAGDSTLLAALRAAPTWDAFRSLVKAWWQLPVKSKRRSAPACLQPRQLTPGVVFKQATASVMTHKRLRFAGRARTLAWAACNTAAWAFSAWRAPCHAPATSPPMPMLPTAVDDFLQLGWTKAEQPPILEIMAAAGTAGGSSGGGSPCLKRVCQLSFGVFGRDGAHTQVSRQCTTVLFYELAQHSAALPT